MVDVSSQNNSASINVSSGGNSASINATPDMAQYYSEKAREWATSNRIVDNTDYSSKYYALNAQSYAQSALETLNNVDSKVQEATDNIEIQKQDVITEIENLSEQEQNKIKDLGIDTRADIDLSNLSEEGEKKIGGGGLEIGDIGIAPLGIDESQNKRRYLNGQIIIQEQFESFTEKLKNAIALYPSLACSEDDWQTKATMTVGGQVGKFVVDDTLGTIRLPRIIMPIQGLTDLSKLAEIVEAELPNITSSDNNFFGTKTSSTNLDNDALYYTVRNTGTGYAGNSQTNASLSTLSFDASRSNSIYKNGATVQQEQIQYPYFIQVATGVEESIDTTRATEIITPYFLGMSQYFETAPNNPSWLKSQGQYNSKAVYPDYYDWLLSEYNNPTTAKTPNYITYGSVSVINNIASNFALDSYIKSLDAISLGQNFEINCKFTTCDNIMQFSPIYSGEGAQFIALQVDYETALKPLIHYYIGNGSQWIQGDAKSGITEILPNTTYYSKLTFDGTTYKAFLSTNEQDWIEDWTFNSTNIIPQCYFTLGVSRDKYFAGLYNIDLTGCNIKQGENYLWKPYIGAVKLATESYTDYDFVINQADETFRLPLLNGSEDLLSDKHIDLTLEASGSKYTAPANGYYYVNKTASATGQYITISGYTSVRDWSSAASQVLLINKYVVKGEKVNISYNLGGTTNALRFIYAKGNGDLYYYVGEGIVNPQLVNVARIEEIKANKTDVDGQWVYNNVRLLSSASFSAFGTRTIDLSDYLPNDGFDYEVFIVCSGVTGKTVGNGVHIMCTTGSSSETNITAFFGQVYVSVANQIQVAQSSHTLPIFANDKAITVYQGVNSACTVNCAIQGYRRLGKNV